MSVRPARQIGVQTGHSPNTILKYLADSEKLNDPKVKEFISRYREQETDHLALLDGGWGVGVWVGVWHEY